MCCSKRNETVLVEINDIFNDKIPITARENAFKTYQNYVDVFLQANNKEYLSYEQTVIELQDFTNSYKREFVKIGNEIILEQQDKIKGEDSNIKIGELRKELKYFLYMSTYYTTF